MIYLNRFKNNSTKKRLSIIAGFILIIGLISVVVVSQQQQDARSRAAGDIDGDFPGDLVGDDYRVAGKVLGSVIGNRNQVSNGVLKNIWGDANSISGNVEGCINGNNNRISGNVVGGVVGLNNIVLGTKGTGDCPLPGAASPTVAPTQAPIITPTIIPSATPTPTQIPTPTPTPTQIPPTSTPKPTVVPPTSTPVPTLQPSDTTLTITLLLHGIGKGGDSANPNGGGNKNPLHPQREINIEILNAQNQLVLSKIGTINYSLTNGNFTGTVNIGTALASGNYIVKVKTLQFLRSIVPGIQTLNKGQNNILQSTVMINGDINSDNALNILDYNILMGCYSDFQPAKSCTAQNKLLSDLDDDGATNQFDYNLFLRELTNRDGQ